MSLRRLHPPHQLLRAFSTVVRFGGVSRAAESLHLTQSAVSKQIQELERWIGVVLFERSRKRLSLTPAGERYEKAVRAVLAQLETATLELITSGGEGGALHLSALPTFGAKWLIPRLPAFQHHAPQVTLHFVPFVHGYDFQRPELDCSILFGDGHWPDARSHYLAGHDVALIAPRPGSSDIAIRSVQDLSRCTLLRHVTVPDAWLRWSEAHGVDRLDSLGGPQFDQFQTMIRAVTVGMGVALVPRCLVQDEIAAGTVDEPLAGGGYRSTMGYWFCYPEGRARLAPLVAFRDWLLPQAEADPLDGLSIVATEAPAPPPSPAPHAAGSLRR